MLPVEIDTPTIRHSQFSEEGSKTRLRCATYLIYETQDVTYIIKFFAKQRETKRYNSKVVPRETHGLILRQVIVPTQIEKLNPNWERPYQICQKLPNGAYKLKELNGRFIPRTWNIVNLIIY